MILENGVIRTLDPSLPVARALAVAGGRIAGGIGTHETALASPEVVDLGGRCVLPGFTDSHVHFATWAVAQTSCGSRTRRRSKRRSRACATRSQGYGRAPGCAVAAGEAATGRRTSSRRGTSWTSSTTDVPIALMARDSHSLWLNSAALARANGDLEVPGGVVERDERGEPTGVLREESCWTFRDRHVEISDDEYVEAMRVGMKLANSRGVVAVHDKDGWLGALRFWQELREREALTLRVWQSLPHEKVGELESVDVRSGLGDEFLRVGYLKAFMDGTLGSQTARLLDGSGVQITSREELEEIVRRGARAGFPVAVHAIGDLANREALDAFEATQDVWRPLGLRHRIEHAQLLADEDVPRFAQLGVAASVQFTHAVSDRDLADRFWAGESHRAYRWRALWDAGTLVANGSDAPIEELDPWAGVAAGVRKTWDDREPWHPEEAVTLDEALLATCVNPTFLSRDERRRGRLVPGLAADLVVLDRDPYEVEPDALGDVQVVATMVNGRWVHNPPPWD